MYSNSPDEVTLDELIERCNEYGIDSNLRESDIAEFGSRPVLTSFLGTKYKPRYVNGIVNSKGETIAIAKSIYDGLI